MIGVLAFQIFNKSIKDYHNYSVLKPKIKNPYPENTFKHLVYKKNWIDTIQWHFEDEIRNPQIKPKKALKLKRKIDILNQKRTDIVEQIDVFFYNQYADVELRDDYILNTESPAWAIDKLSILALKIFHMNEETKRNSSSSHKKNCKEKLKILLAQKNDLIAAIDQLILNIQCGKIKMNIYKQMKMYNDENLNPVLYKNQ